MKKYFLLLLIALVGCTKTIDKDQLQKRDDGKAYEVNANIPFTGEVTLDKYGARESYSNGVLDGVCIYNSEGHKYKEVYYKNGILEGKSIYYYTSNGAKHFESSFQNGTLDGKFESWWENGQNMCDVNVDSNSFLTPVSITKMNGNKETEPKYIFGNYPRVVSKLIDDRHNTRKQIVNSYGQPSYEHSATEMVAQNKYVKLHELNYFSLEGQNEYLGYNQSITFTSFEGKDDYFKISYVLSGDDNYSVIKKKLDEAIKLFTGEEIVTKKQTIYDPEDYMKLNGIDLYTWTIKKPYGYIEWGINTKGRFTAFQFNIATMK